MLRFLFAQLLHGFQAGVLRERTGRCAQAALRFDSYFQRFSLKERRATASCLVSQVAAISRLVADRERQVRVETRGQGAIVLTFSCTRLRELFQVGLEILLRFPSQRPAIITVVYSD